MMLRPRYVAATARFAGVAVCDGHRFVSTMAGVPPPALSLMSWSVDMSERAMHGVPRRMPKNQRIPEIVKVILSTRPDVVCLQDSSQELCHAITAAAVTTTTTTNSSSTHCDDDIPTVAAVGASPSATVAVEYELVGAARNGNHGWMQTFVRKDAHWCGTALPECAFCTIALQPRGGDPAQQQLKQRGTGDGAIRITNFDLAYRGKGIPAVDGSRNNDGGGLNIGAFVLPRDRGHGDVDPHRKVAIRHMVDVTRPHIAVGSTYMGNSETLHQPLYSDAWAVSGADVNHEHTINTTPIFVAPSAVEANVLHAALLPEAAMTNFFYYKEPRAYESGGRPRSQVRTTGGGSGDVIWPPCVQHSVQLPTKAPPSSSSSSSTTKTVEGSTTTKSDDSMEPSFVTTVAGRYQRTFLRKGRHPSDTLLKRYQHKSFVVLRPWVVTPLNGDGAAPSTATVLVAPTEQAPTLMMLA